MTRKGLVLIFVFIFILAGFAQLTFGLINVGNDDMRLVNTGYGVSYGFDAHPSFHSNGSRFFYFATHSGIRYVNSANGETRWPEAFSITRPHMAARGDVVAVGDIDRGRTIHVYDPDGLMYTVSLDHPTLGFSVNSTGYLSVIVQRDAGYGIYVYNRRYSFEPLFSQAVYADRPMQFPVAAEVSDDGRFVAIAFLDLSLNLTTEIEFRVINPWDAPWGTESLFAKESFPDEAFLGMRFMADNHVLLVTDHRITLKRIIGNDVQEQWTEVLHNRLDQLAFCGNNRFAVVAGAPLSPDGRDADPLGTVSMFDMSGLTGRFYLGRRATHLSMGHNALIVGADRYFHAVNARGESMWHHVATHDVRDMIFLDNTDTVLIAGPNRAYVWRRQRGRDAQPSTLENLELEDEVY